MAGELAINQIQLGDHSDPARNFVFRTNVDGTMTLARGNIGATTQNILQVNAQGVVQVVPQSMVRVNTANGFGTTNTVIRRFLNILTNQGGDISYADSATLGASFTINTDGAYAINYSDSFGVASDFGMSLNSPQLTTSINSITVATKLIQTTVSTANGAGAVGWVGYLPAGSVIRPHTNGNGGGTTDRVIFTITRVA